MSDNYWARRLAGITTPGPQATATVPQGGAWWQQPQAPAQAPQTALQAQMPGSMPEEQYIRQLQRTPADQLNADQMEQIAEWELRTKQKYNTQCPQCGSANYVPAGTRLAGITFPTEKCFDCGLSARGPEPSLGGRAGAGVPTMTTRQTDTGGGAGSMYMQFNGVPSSYMPRGG